SELWAASAWPARPGVMWPPLGGGISERRAPEPVLASPNVVAPPPRVVAPHKAAAPPRGSKTQPEWTALIESLRKDIERFEGHGPRQVIPNDAAARAAESAASPKRRTRKAKNAQDEWGFFDPEQCGFSALLAKLEEVTGPKDDEPLDV